MNTTEKLAATLRNFEITGPDADGLVWLVLHGNGTTGKAMFQLGTTARVAVQVALCLEKERRAALEAERAAPAGQIGEVVEMDDGCRHVVWRDGTPEPGTKLYAVPAAPADDDAAASAAMREGNRLGVRSIDALRIAVAYQQATPAAPAPAGFMLVPVNPTPEMRTAGAARHGHSCETIYRAMLGSAPQRPAQAVPQPFEQ